MSVAGCKAQGARGWLWASGLRQRSAVSVRDAETMTEGEVFGDPGGMAALGELLADWGPDPSGVRHAFLRLKDRLQGLDGARFNVELRQGVSLSLRAGVKGNGFWSRPVFAVIDVVEDSDGRWLSVCFYADAVADPEERGNLVPLGLFGEDGYCFDVAEEDDSLLAYLDRRITEAHRTATSLPTP